MGLEQPNNNNNSRAEFELAIAETERLLKESTNYTLIDVQGIGKHDSASTKRLQGGLREIAVIGEGVTSTYIINIATGELKKDSFTTIDENNMLRQDLDVKLHSIRKQAILKYLQSATT